MRQPGDSLSCRQGCLAEDSAKGGKGGRWFEPANRLPPLPLTSDLEENTDTGEGNWSALVTPSRPSGAVERRWWGSRFHPILVARHTLTALCSWRIRLDARLVSSCIQANPACL